MVIYIILSFIFCDRKNGSIKQLGFFRLVMATSLGKRKNWIQTNCTSLKNWPCISSCPWGEGPEERYLFFSQHTLKDRFEAEWHQALAGPPADGWWCHWLSLHSTRLLGLVQAMSRHPCRTYIIFRVGPSPAVGSFGSHEPMTNIYPAGLQPWLVPDLPLPKPPSIKKTLCQVLWWEAETNIAHGGRLR